MAQRQRKKGKNFIKPWFMPKWAGVLFLLAITLAIVAGGTILPRFFLATKKQSQPQFFLGKPTPIAGELQFTLPDFVFPEVTVPASPVPATPSFVFTQAEITQLNDMLTAWAAVQTFVSEESLKSDESIALAPKEVPKEVPKEEKIYVADGGNNVSVWFLDIESSLQYQYNAQFYFSYASLMKAPYAAWLYTLAEAGQCNLEEIITIKPEDIGKYKDNTGVIKKMELPADFTVEALIGHMLRSSDTVALKILLARYPAQAFNQWAAQQGVQDVNALNSVLSGKSTAQDMGALMQGVYSVMQNGVHGLALRTHMENAGNRMIKSSHAVARKYGWDEKAYHDMGAVFAPHPYLLVIMTDKWGGSYEETAMFGTITQTLEAMAAAKWAEHEAAMGES